MRLVTDDCILVNIDFQEKLLPHMMNNNALVEKVIKLIKGLTALEVPMLTTQQYTKGLGYTDQRISEALGYKNPEELPFIEKSSFSAMDCQEFRDRLDSSGRRNVIITGIEGHVCVTQTIVDLKAAGYNPVPVYDCISSRKKEDYKNGIRRWEHENALPACFETVLFELCRYSGSSVFKEISVLVK